MVQQDDFCTASAATVEARAREVNTELTIVSPMLGLIPRGSADAVAGNREAANVVPQQELIIATPPEPSTYW